MSAVAASDAAPTFAATLPGPVLAMLLAARRPAELDDFDVIELARAARKLASWAMSVEYGAIAELASRRAVDGKPLGAWDSDVGEWVADEIGAALTLSGVTAAREVTIAQHLAETLPATLAALADGRIDTDKARAIGDGLSGLPDGLAREIEARVLPAAPLQTCAQLRAAIRAAVRAADPQWYARRRKDAEADRRLEVWDNDAGTSDLTGRHLPTTAATAAYNRVNAIAQALKSDGDPRPIDQLRADVFLDLLRNERPATQPARPPSTAAPADAVQSHDATAPQVARPQPDETSAPDRAKNHHQDPTPTPDRTKDLHQDAAPGRSSADGSRHGVDDQYAIADAVAASMRHEVAELTDGLGRDGRVLGGRAALVREAARRVTDALADLRSRWCVTTTGAAGEVIQHGTGSYRIPAEVRRGVQARDVTCRFPTCRRQAVHADIDHTLAYHRGGATCPCNLSVLCRRHHRLKQRPEWTLIQMWPGVVLWISPTGHWYITGPPGGSQVE